MIAVDDADTAARQSIAWELTSPNDGGTTEASTAMNDANTGDRRRLEEIETTTLRDYDENAAAFWERTRDHDVTQNYASLLSPFPAGQPLDILDFGCGPGRDLKYFRSLGHRPVGLDGSAVFCAMAREYSGCPVLEQHFLKLGLPATAFDGVFANASLFHVPAGELPRVLGELRATLRPGGVLFTSNPRGSGSIWSGARFGHYLEFAESRRYLEDAGFELITHYYRPSGLPRAQQPWLAIVNRRVERD
jgi:SAM-dependent methyltransferase